MEPKITRRLIFAFLIFVGMGLLVAGPVIEVTRPHFMLDVVLTPEQLKDYELRERTLARLKIDSHIDWTAPTVAALALIVAGGIGLAVEIARLRFIRATRAA